MKTDLLSFLQACLLGGAAVLGACSAEAESDEGASSSSSSSGSNLPGADAGCPATEAACPAAGEATPGDEQTPPTGDLDAIRAWIAEGSYTQWTCEDEAHPGRKPSPHETNRICSNAKMTEHVAGEYAVGAANVKELYRGDGTIAGHAFYVKVGSGGGESWYWFEEADGLGLVASSRGDVGAAKSVCVGCHAGAPYGFVFTLVK